MYYATIIDSKNEIILLTVIASEYALSLISCEQENALEYEMMSRLPCTRHNGGKVYKAKDGYNQIHYWDIATDDVKLLMQNSADKPTEIRALRFSEIMRYGKFFMFSEVAIGRLVEEFVRTLTKEPIEPDEELSKLDSMSEEEQKGSPLWFAYQELTLRNKIP